MKKVNKNSLHEANKDEGGVSILSIIKFIFMMFIAWTTLTFLNLGFKEISPVNEINGKIFGSNSWLVNEGSSQINIKPSDSTSQATSANNYENQTVATNSANSSETINNQDPSIKNELVPEENNIQSNSNSQLNQKQNCNECQGTGSVSCNDCAGSGQHRCDFCRGSKIRYDDICSECKGSGMERCRTCFGRGKTKCYKCDGLGHL